MKIENLYYLNVRMASEYLHVARSTIYKWVEENYIPHKKLGKRVLFIKDHLDDWVLNNGVIMNDLPDAPKFNTTVTERPIEEYHRRPKFRPAA